MDWLDRRARHLTPDDLPLIEELISTRSWWDTVDILASHLAGGILRRHRDLASAKVGEWLDSGELWLQRTALLCQLKWKTDTDRDLLALAIDRTRDSPEFFLRKAIGWALREYAKTDPGWVRAYVDRTPNLSPLSRREALKHEDEMGGRSGPNPIPRRRRWWRPLFPGRPADSLWTESRRYPCRRNPKNCQERRLSG